MPTVICDECGGKTDSYVYCETCWDGLNDEIKELKAQVESLENENEELKSEIFDLKEERK